PASRAAWMPSSTCSRRSLRVKAAREAGFERIKLNCVVQKGRNDDETLHLVQHALPNQLDISSIEETPL
ncbi:GTP 3',8-cyclase MoaA, partial [Pseudomonas aeruginosa]